MPQLPWKGSFNPNAYKLYFMDTDLFVASLDDEASYALRINRNFNTYKGAIYENIVSDMLLKSGYNLFYYRNEKSTIEMDSFVRDANSLRSIFVLKNIFKRNRLIVIYGETYLSTFQYCYLTI